MIVFEIISWYGRRIKRHNTKLRIRKEPILLDIGSGNNFRQNWIHADFFQLPRLKFWKKYPNRNRPELELDLRYPINCPDNIVDGIYSGHTLEHLYPNEAEALLKEIFRILRPSSWLRINVPDIEIAVNFYVGKNNIFQDCTGCEIISDFCQNWGHRSAWDETLLKKKLQLIGFINVKKVEFGKGGTDKRLIKEEKVRENVTLVMEAQKPANNQKSL